MVEYNNFVTRDCRGFADGQITVAFVILHLI